MPNAIQCFDDSVLDNKIGEKMQIHIRSAANANIKYLLALIPS